MLTEALEQIHTYPPPKRAAYARIILAILTVMVVGKALWFLEKGFWYGSQAVDFSAFYIVAQRNWAGDLDLTYQLSSFMKMQFEASGGVTSFMPWTYPPQFGLLLAPLALLPGWVAYLLFTTVTLGLYAVVLRQTAGNNFAQVIIIFFPAIAITIGCGQNGLLTGALIGLLCINADKRPVVAGLVLGAMFIKPHLAIAAGIYFLLTRNWQAIATAVAVVVASSALCTIVYGPHIWSAWLAGIRELAGYLEQGRYPLYRMISAYAVLHKAGVPAVGAVWVQMVVAGLALAAVALAVFRGPSGRFALGVMAVVSVMISPYAYDYDLPIVGIGLALLLPDLAVLASRGERGVLYGLMLLANTYGLLQSARLSRMHVTGDQLDQYLTPAVSGVALMSVLAMVLRLLLRSARRGPAPILLSNDPNRMTAPKIRSVADL